MKFLFQCLFIKLYWYTAMPIYLHNVYSCFWAVTVELSSCKRPYGTQNLKYLLFGPLHKKVANPALGNDPQ